MELAFSTKKLRTICEVEAEAVRKLGHEYAPKLFSRLSDLRAAEVVTDLIAGKPQHCLYRKTNAFSVQISPEYKIIFLANHVNPPILESGECDWSRVSRIKIVSIEING